MVKTLCIGGGMTKLVLKALTLLGFLGVILCAWQQQPRHKADPLSGRSFDIQGIWSYYEIRLQMNEKSILTCIGATNGFLKVDVKEDRYEYSVEADNVDTGGNYFYETFPNPASIYFEDVDLTHWPVVNVRVNDTDWLRFKVVNRDCMMSFYWIDKYKIAITAILHRVDPDYFARPFYVCPPHHQRIEEGFNAVDECSR